MVTLSVHPPLERATDAKDYDVACREVREWVSELCRRYQDNGLTWALFGPNTTDYPGTYVARPWVSYPRQAPLAAVIWAPDLDTLRSLLPAGLYVKLDPSPGDDTNIIETWI